MGMVNNLSNENSERENEIKKENLIKLSKEQIIDEFIKLSEAKRVQEDFILNISHDLRSPLNVILSILQCYRFEYTMENQKKLKEHMDIIKRNGYKILKLIDNLIDSTKLDTKYYELKKENIDIISLIEWNISSIDKYASQKNISLVFDTNVEECIMAIDAEAIDRIIMNLISNAIKFSPENSNIYINALKNKDNIRISVKDQGMGIIKEEQKAIFNRFIQSSRNKKNEHSGSGIGLDLVKRLVDAHDGTIDLISEKNKGSEFVINLPISLLKCNSKDKNKCLDARNKVDILEVEFSDIYL